ncbi:MAG: glutaredoxin family protein [Natronospirillum sp.]|uniref:glutaredoxin family protein n=1 Tax=Natronospirillum sp. TaxID=2812955 RepID=UPI0025EF5A21|nr:glutaredoxin family protein [Natronospirillum sp.]MCH8550663.1 glutaredoxin family protein [Natronospirillum sp.]
MSVRIDVNAVTEALPLQLQLMETSHCHLCETAVELLLPYVEAGICQVELVDIAEEDRLLANYAERIPVLRHEQSATELGWPFDAETLDHWLQQRVESLA